MTRYDRQRANCQEPTCKPGACIKGWEIVDTTDGQVVALRKSRGEAEKVVKRLNLAEERGYRPRPSTDEAATRLHRRA